MKPTKLIKRLAQNDKSSTPEWASQIDSLPGFKVFGPFLWLAKMIVMFNIQDELDALHEMWDGLMARRAERQRREALPEFIWEMPMDNIRRPCPHAQKVRLSLQGAVNVLGLLSHAASRRQWSRRFWSKLNYGAARHMRIRPRARLAFGRTPEFLIPD